MSPMPVTNSSRWTSAWVGYAAALWSLVFGIFHVVWAAGWYLGLPAGAGKAFEQTWVLVYDLVIAGICFFAVFVALALVQPWGQRLPRRVVSVVAWTGTGLLVLRGGGGAMQTAYFAATGRDINNVWAVWEAWFCVGAVLFWLSTRRFRGAAATSPDAS